MNLRFRSVPSEDCPIPTSLALSQAAKQSASSKWIVNILRNKSNDQNTWKNEFYGWNFMAGFRNIHHKELRSTWCYKSNSPLFWDQLKTSWARTPFWIVSLFHHQNQLLQDLLPSVPTVNRYHFQLKTKRSSPTTILKISFISCQKVWS